MVEIKQSNSQQQLVSVIVPVFQQEETIKQDLVRLNQALSQSRFPYEIIAVVDGITTDNSYQLIKKLVLPQLKVFGYSENNGKGYAVRYGMKQAQGDYIAFIDAGMDIDPNGISMILEHMLWYEADIIVGSKRHPASKVSYPLSRKVLSWGYHLLTRFLFGIKVSDTQTGLKVFRRKVIETILPRMLMKKFAFDIEMLSIARRLGYDRIYEAPIELDKQRFQFSSTIKWQTAFDMLWNTLAVFYRLNILNYYDDENKVVREKHE